jgi:hypothetical protein
MNFSQGVMRLLELLDKRTLRPWRVLNYLRLLQRRGNVTWSRVSSMRDRIWEGWLRSIESSKRVIKMLGVCVLNDLSRC